MRCTYVLPDGVTHTKGYVKDPDAAQRYLSFGDGSPPQPSETKQIEDAEEPRDRKRVDLTKNVLTLVLSELSHLSNFTNLGILVIYTGV